MKFKDKYYHTIEAIKTKKIKHIIFAFGIDLIENSNLLKEKEFDEIEYIAESILY